MDSMSPQQDSLSRGGQQDYKRRMKSVSYRRQSAPSLVITKALTRSKTVCRESVLAPICPETCPLVQSFLASSDRSFLLHGHGQLKTGLQTQDRHLFLFNDILVIAKAKSANHFKQKAQVRVCEMWTAGCMEEVCEGSTSLERSFVMGWPTCNCVATFSFAEQKERWLSLLKSRIKEEREREEPKTIPLKVYGKEINTVAVIKTLPVSNSDSTSEVIRLALQQFGIAGNVKDYQLWVISKRDNTPYPLIGHEFPFSIQMSHVRDLLCQGGSSRNAAPPPDRQRALQAEQRQADKQCQFILKPRPIAATQQHVAVEPSQKPLKRRRSLINWAFWRGSFSQLNDLSISLSGPAPGCLFGRPLSSVCPEDTLPKPVMDMLVFLYHEGSWTRGIFRRPAGARAVRELRDTLDCGEVQLPLTRDHVFVIAGVFKDFLRSIPDSLLCCELYEEWTDVLEEEEEEKEHVQHIQRLICRLPKENALLLRYLVAMLHGIQSNAHDNQMTSFNLSVCIAPSMLWPPGPCSPEVEGQGAKKVCELVKFMIDHCQQVLGEEPTSLFGGLPQKHSVEEIGSDTWWPYPLTDSSYNSLENEFDDYSSGGSPTLQTRMERLTTKGLQGSLDSDISQEAQTVDTSSLENRCRPRRCSEPAIAYMAEFRVCISGSGEGLAGEDEDDDEEISKGPGSHTQTDTHSRGQNSKVGYDLGLGWHGALEASSSSLSSTPNSPAPTRCSLDSLDSLCSDQTWQTRRGLCPTKAHLPFTPSSMAVPSTSGSLSTSAPSTPSTPGSAPVPGGDVDRGPCPKGTPPKEPLSWGTLKGSIQGGFHPNSWLKKARRLSLTQQDNLEKEEEYHTGEGSINKSLTLSKLGPEKGGPGGKEGGRQISTNNPKSKLSCRTTKEGGRGRGGQAGGRSVPEPPKPRLPKQNSSSPPSHHRSTGSLQCPVPKTPCFRPSDPPLTVQAGSDVTDEGQAVGSDARHPPQGVFYKRSGPILSLFRRHVQKSHSLAPVEVDQDRFSQRRASEPERLVVDQASTFYQKTLQRQGACRRLSSDLGLKVSKVDPQGGTSEPPFCLSPYDTKAVRDYFSSHPCSNPPSSQQVALALVESRREWLRRCSDPMAETDFDQLMIAEESHV